MAAPPPVSGPQSRDPITYDAMKRRPAVKHNVLIVVAEPRASCSKKPIGCYLGGAALSTLVRSSILGPKRNASSPSAAWATPELSPTLFRSAPSGVRYELSSRCLPSVLSREFGHPSIRAPEGRDVAVGARGESRSGGAPSTLRLFDGGQGDMRAPTTSSSLCETSG